MIFAKMSVLIRQTIYKSRARFEDWQIGKVSLGRTIPSKYRQIGAYATQSTDYRCLDQIFRALPLQKDDVFVDVGCGEGRVLTYLYLRKFRGTLMGIELDPDIAEIARSRTEKCPNIEIHCGNVLESREIIAKTTVFYLFNPFNDSVLSEFIQAIEDNCDHPVRLYYCNDLYRKRIDKREKWNILRRNVILRPGLHPMYYTIYVFSPN